jgi:hypothetical protein
LIATYEAVWPVRTVSFGWTVVVVVDVHFPEIRQRVRRLLGVGRGARQLNHIARGVEGAVGRREDRRLRRRVAAGDRVAAAEVVEAGTGRPVERESDAAARRRVLPARDRELPSRAPFLNSCTVPSARARAPS